jgi:hypothetical protein
MGYYTHFKLEVDVSNMTAIPEKKCANCGQVTQLAVDPLDVIRDYELSSWGTIGEVMDMEESSKWYEHEEDMKSVSKKFPDALFTLRGEGEEAGDVWVKYFRNGKMQVEKAEIKLAGFDPKKLK